MRRYVLPFVLCALLLSGVAYADETVSESEPGALVEESTAEMEVEESESVVESAPVDGEASGDSLPLETLPDYSGLADDVAAKVVEEIQPYANYDVYDGSISTTYTTYFSGVLEKLGYGVDYVLFRSDQYDYIFAYGALVYSGGVISGSDVSVIAVNTRNGTIVSYRSEASFSVSVGSSMAYSNLGEFPMLYQGVKGYEGKAVVYGLAVLFLYFVLRDIFKAGRGIG